MTTNPPEGGDRLESINQSIATLLEARNEVLEAICAFNRAYEAVDRAWLQLQATRQHQ